MLHVYTIVEGTFFLSYFKQVFSSKRIKIALTIIRVIFPLICLVNLFFFQSIFTYNTHTRPLEALLISFFCFLHFYVYSGQEQDDEWFKKDVNWINLGVALYFPAALTIFVFANYFRISVNQIMNDLILGVHAALVLVMYLFWAYAFRIAKHGR